jgi:hypothetical protein
MPARVRRLRHLPLLLAAAACGGDGGGGPEPVVEPPEIVSAAVEPGPHNVLSAVVRLEVRDADSVAVRFGAAGQPATESTPPVVPATESLALPVLALRAATAYEFTAIAWRGDTSSVSAALPLTTGPLPADLPQYTAGGPAPSPGYVAFSAGVYAVVIDDAGRVVWYRALAAPTLNVQPLPTGGYAAHPTNPDPADLSPWTEYDALGNVVRTYGCAGGLRSRFHDLVAEPDGARWLLCDETRTMDLSALGGDPAAQVTATVVQLVAADGTLRFQWNAFDHFSLADLDPALRAGRTVNFTHGNSLDFDAAGHLVLSFRSLNEVTWVDVGTGSVLGRMGGLANQFAFDEAGLPYVRQHGARALPDGRVVLLDNLGQQDGSRAEQYAIDWAQRRAIRERAAAPALPTTAVLGGAVQVLPDGHLLVAYGNGNRVQEYDGAGQVAWEIHGDAGYVYRATRIASLYRPGEGLDR